MKARHVIGIVLLVLALFCLGPMVLIPGFHFQEIPQHQARWWFGVLLFGVPAAALILIGALVVGPDHRIQAAAWTLLGGAMYGGFLLLTMAPMMASPEWGDMMATVQVQQGQRPLTMSLQIERPLYLTALLALLGAGGLFLHHVVLKSPSTGEAGLSESAPPLPEESRPLSVTVLSWILIVTSVVGLLNFLFNAGRIEDSLSAVASIYGGPSPATQLGLVIGNLSVSVLCGMFLLRGASWARWLLVVTTVVGLVVGGLIYGLAWAVLPGLLWLGVYVYFLFLRAPAAAWFSRSVS